MVILKNVPRILSPQLLSVLARMGHGDEIGKHTDVAERLYGVKNTSVCAFCSKSSYAKLQHAPYWDIVYI